MQRYTMHRYAIAIAMLLLSAGGAPAQIYNPAGPSIPAPPPPPTPPAATPGMEAPPPLIGRNSATDQTRARPNIAPGSPGRETTQDRSVSCSHQAAALGVPASEAGRYTRDCINSR
jgi:hypothetical protein